MFDGIAAARIKSRLHTFADVVVVLTSQTDYMGVIFLSLLALFLCVLVRVCVNVSLAEVFRQSNFSS